MRKVLLAVLALSASLMSVAQDKEQTIKVGDKVRVQPTVTHFLTMEEIPAWVYDSVMTVEQIGCKWFPDGVLLAPISSWISKDAIERKSCPAQPKKAVQKEQPTEKP